MLSDTESSTIAHYEVQETLFTQGFCRVKRARNTLTGQQCALKFIKKSKTLSSPALQRLSPMLEHEYEIQSKLSHPNILPAHELALDAVYRKSQHPEVQVMYLETDFCLYQDFFTLQAAVGGPLEEVLARRFFQQLIGAVAFCHKNRVIHWNLRPESLLLDSDFSLQLTNFGSSPKSVNATACTAPEVLSGDVRSGSAVDVFCCGFILFFWTYFEPPFQRADSSNSHYRQLTNGQEKFWLREQNPDGVSEDLKSLLAGMLAIDPTQRLSISEIKAHPWFTQPPLNAAESREILISKIDFFAQKKRKRVSGKRKEWLTVSGLSAVYRNQSESGSDFSSSISSQGSSSSIPSYSTAHWKFSELFFSVSVDVILTRLDEALEAVYAQVEDRRNPFKIKASVVTDTESISFIIRLLDCGGEKYCLDFSQKTGNFFDFYQTFNEISGFFEQWSAED